MPRPIKNDTPSNAQLQDLIRPIVKSEIRRRDGAITSIPLDPNGALQFTSSGLSVKPGEDIIFLSGTGVEIHFFTKNSDQLEIDAESLLGNITTSITWNAESYYLETGKDIVVIANTGMGLSAVEGIGITSGGQVKITSGLQVDLQSSTDINILAFDFINITCGSDITIDSFGGQIYLSSAITILGSACGFFGAAPVGRPGTYTIVAAPAVTTALNADANGGAYAGVPAALADAATRANLNDLRADVANISAVLRQLIKHLGDTSGLGLINETSY